MKCMDFEFILKIQVVLYYFVSEVEMSFGYYES